MEKKVPPNFFSESKEPNKTKQKINIPKPLKEVERKKNERIDEQFKKTVNKRVNPYYFTHKVLKAGYKKN